MNIQLPILLSFIAGLGTLLGACLVFIKEFNKTKYIPLFLSISATIMMSFSIFDLIPESFIYITANTKAPQSIFIIVISFCLGSLLIKILDTFYHNDNNLKKIGVLSLISLALHNFPEGIATFISTMVNIRIGISLSIGILLHNIPEGICIALPLYHATKSKKKVFTTALFASLAEPLGGLSAYYLLADSINNLTISIVLLFVAGIMTTLSINTIYKEALKDKHYFKLGILIGFIISIIAILI